MQAQNLQSQDLQTYTLETFCNELDAYLRGQAPKAPKAPKAQAHTLETFCNPLRQSYRHHNPLILTADQQADLEIAKACVALDAALQANGLTPDEVHHYHSALAVSALIDESDEIEARIEAKSNLIDSWIAGQASWGEVVQVHAPKATYTQRLVKRAYAVAYVVAGYVRIR